MEKCVVLKHLCKTLFTLCIACTLVSTSTFQAYAQSSEEELFLVTQKAFEDGFYDVAIRYINQLLKEYPHTDKEIQANLLLGQCYFFKKQYLKAYEIFQGLLQSPQFKDATLFWLGETYLKGSDYAQAEVHYKELIKLYPESIYTPQAAYSLGWVHFDRGEYKKSKQAFQDLISKFPAHQLSEDAAFKIGECEYNLKSFDQTIEYFKRFVLKYPKSSRHAESYFYIAESYYYQHNNLNAISYYAKTANISYDNKLILMAKVSLGWSYLKLEKFDLSQKYFDEALALAQEKGILSDDVLLGQATLFSEMRNYQNAINAYNDLIETFPNSRRLGEAYLGKANIQYMLKDYNAAIETYLTLIEKIKNEESSSEEIYGKSHFGLAWSYLKSGNIDQAITVFQEVRDRTESKTIKISALTQIGDAYQDAGQLQKAIHVYDSILQDFSDSPYTDYIQYRQGVALLKLGKIEAATLSFQSLQLNFPKSEYIKDTKYYLAVSYFEKGDWATAREQILIFLDNLPSSNAFAVEAYYILALSHFNLLDYAKALSVFEKIIKNYPFQTNIVKNVELNIAKCYYELANTQEATKRFKLLVNKYTKSDIAEESLIWLGDHFLDQAEFDIAITYYQQFIDEFAGSDKLNEVYYDIGQAHEAKKEYDKAIEMFKQINDPSDRRMYAKAKLAIASIFAQDLDTNSALKTYTNIIKTSPEFQRDAYVRIAEIHKKNKDFDQAREAYHAALKAEQSLSEIDNVTLQFYIGDIYELARQNAEAVEEYLKISYLYPKEEGWIIKAYLRTARIFENDDKWEEAKLTYQKILKYNTEEAKFAQERLEWINENFKN